MIQQISVQELSKKQKDKASFQLLDCREAEELEIVKIEGATHIPMGQIPGRLAELDKEKELVVFCHRGGRSMRVVAFLDQQGFKNVKNLTGGVDAWASEIDPKLARY